MTATEDIDRAEQHTIAMMAAQFAVGCTFPLQAPLARKLAESALVLYRAVQEARAEEQGRAEPADQAEQCWSCGREHAGEPCGRCTTPLEGAA